MKSLLIIGAGEFGQLVKELAVDCGYEKIDFLDDHASIAIGKVDEYEKFVGIYNDFNVAIGRSEIRQTVTEKLESTFRLVTLIHPSATISKSAQIEEGCIVEAQAVVNTSACVKKCSFINAGAIVNHNSIVEEYCQIDCNAVVAARAIVPFGTKVMSCIVWTKA